MKITKYLSPEDGQGGGTENDNLAFANFKPVPAPASTTPPANPAGIPPATTEQETLETLLGKDETTLSVEEKVQLEALKGKFNVEEINEDGTALTPEQKQAKIVASKKLTDILAKPETQRTLEEIKFIEDNTQKPVNVYEEVDQLSGIPVTFTADPAVKAYSSEWIAQREAVIREQAAQEYDQQLKEESPLAYQFMLHVKAGGNPQDFLQRDTEDYQSITLVKNDIATQENIYRKALTLKGNTADQVDTLVQSAKDKGKLFEFSNTELTALQKRQVQEEQKRETAVKQQEARSKQLVNTFYTELDRAITTGIKGVAIPKTEHKAFAEFVRENTYVDGGKLIYVKELDPKNLQDELAANYFKFKKADLAGIIARKAGSLNAEKVKANVTKYKITPKTTENQPIKFVPMNKI